MFGMGGGAAAHRRLETVKDGTQACAQEGGKEREGGRARLGKSEGGGGRTGGRQWKNCEMCLVKPFFFTIIQTKCTISILSSGAIFMHEATKHEFHVLTRGYHLSGIKWLPSAFIYKFYLWSLELWCPRCSFQPDTLCLSKLTAFGTSVPKTKNSWAAPKTFPVQPPGSNKKWWKQDRAEHKAERGRASKKERDTCFFFVTVYTNIQIRADTRCKIAHGNHFYTPSSSASPSTHEHTHSRWCQCTVHVPTVFSKTFPGPPIHLGPHCSWRQKHWGHLILRGLPQQAVTVHLGSHISDLTSSTSRLWWWLQATTAKHSDAKGMCHLAQWGQTNVIVTGSCCYISAQPCWRAKGLQQDLNYIWDQTAENILLNKNLCVQILHAGLWKGQKNNVWLYCNMMRLYVDRQAVGVGVGGTLNGGLWAGTWPSR